MKINKIKLAAVLSGVFLFSTSAHSSTYIDGASYDADYSMSKNGTLIYYLPEGEMDVTCVFSQLKINNGVSGKISPYLFFYPAGNIKFTQGDVDFSNTGHALIPSKYRGVVTGASKEIYLGIDSTYPESSYKVISEDGSSTTYIDPDSTVTIVAHMDVRTSDGLFTVEQYSPPIGSQDTFTINCSISNLVTSS